MLKKMLLTLVVLSFLLGLSLAVRHFATVNNNIPIDTTVLFSANLVDAKGIKQNLSQYQGKIIVLNFWATWCPPCREEMPELSQLHLAYQNKNVVVLGVAIDDLNLVKDFLHSAPVSYPIFVAENGHMDLSNQLGNDKDVLPYTAIINTDGNMVKTYFGRINKPLLEAAIQPLLPR